MKTATELQIPQKPKRTFLPEQFSIKQWEQIAPYVDELLERPIDSADDLKAWLQDLSELEAVVGEDFRWRYVRTTCNTTDKEAEKELIAFINDIQPKYKVAQQKIHQKLVDSPFTKELDQHTYGVYLKTVANSLELYREENLPIFKELSLKEQQHGTITANMTIEHEGKEYTLQQAANLLKSKDRQLRQTIYRKVYDRRLQDREKLDKLLDELMALRQKIAKNAGFDNYRDYKHQALDRFDYSPQDCFTFHEAIADSVVPMVKQIQEDRKAKMGVDTLRPWDLEVDAEGRDPLTPFEGTEDFVAKAVNVLRRLSPYFGDRLAIMEEMGYLDLDSRKGKAPGGYNMSMPEIGVPFIFMNAAGSERDVRTLIHEAGHAVHTFLSHPLEHVGLKSYPSEVAELASMSMELMTMDYWDEFYKDEDALRRAKRGQLEGVFKTLPWVATIDKFQHWLYLNEGHSAGQRRQEWEKIHDEFSGGVVSWEGLEDYRAIAWQKQLHIFDVPFYYIEYAMAQLGAIAMWRQYKQNPAQAISNYITALEAGSTRSIPEIYELAGIQFRFDKEYVQELMDFLQKEYELLK